MVTYTFNEFRKLIRGIIANPYVPTSYYPTIDEIEEHINDPLFLKCTNEKEIAKYFIWNVISLFDRDKLWHDEHPGHSENTIENNIKFLFTPVKAVTGLHTNAWAPVDDDETKEDKEAAFDYIQDMILSGDIFNIKEDESISNDLYAEIMVKTRYRDYISDIHEGDEITVKFKKKVGITDQKFNSYQEVWKFLKGEF